MSETLVSLDRKITGAKKLKSVVHTMKVLAASNIGQYEAAVRSLGDYHHNIKSGLYICLHETAYFLRSFKSQNKQKNNPAPVCAVIFGSDQGLVGRFNDMITGYAIQLLNSLPGNKHVWAVGERACALLEDAGIQVNGTFEVPSSVNTISGLGSRILLETEKYRENSSGAGLYVFHNTTRSGAVYEPVHQRILPLDEKWLHDISDMKWPTKNLPEAMHGENQTIPALLDEYLFVSLFKASSESLMSENAARLAAMQRAEKNIDELLDNMTLTYHRTRQDSIDEELFDVISGSEKSCAN